MPGITGIIRQGAEEVERDLGSMLQTLRHDPLYTYGQFADRDLGIHVGWTAHPGSYTDCMPLVNEARDTVIILQGEIFSDTDRPGDVGAIQGKGGPDSAHKLLDLYAEHGDQFFAALNGWYAGVVIDRTLRKVTLFNDRYGMSRIYCHSAADEFIFSSEAKALLKIRPALRKIAPDKLAERFRYNCVLNDESIFSGVSLLPRGSAWSFDGAPAPRKRKYFDFAEWEAQDELPEEQFYSEWARTISTAFPKYALEGSKVGLSSTAGLDTRLIMAALGEQNRLHPSYTFAGAWGELFDVRTARKAAAVYEQPFTAIPITEKFLRDFGDYATRTIHVSDGTHDAFAAHDVFFNEFAREIAPIRLTGKFGSEVVRIRRLMPSETYAPGFLVPELQALVDRLPHFNDTNPHGHPLTRVVTEEIPWHEHGRLAVEQAAVTMRTPYMDNDLVKLMYCAPKGSRAAGDLQERYVKERAPEFARFVTNLGRFSSTSPMLTKLCYYPFWAMFKVEYTYLYATPHWLTRLDRALASWHLEKLLSGRQKWEGYRIWMKTHFDGFLRDTLSNSQADYTRFFDYKAVNQMVERHTAGTHNYFDEINRALTTELICSSLLKEGGA
jgi:asparagine synthase (glutamine-hydrolysing)